MLFFSEHFNVAFLLPQRWKCNVIFFSGVDCLLSNRIKEMALQRDQTNKGIFLSSLRADLYLYFQLKVHSPELYNSVLNSCSWGFQAAIWRARRPSPELDLPGVPSSTVGTLTSLRLPDPWQSPRNAAPNLRSLKLWVSDSFCYRNQVAPFPSLQIPG